MLFWYDKWLCPFHKCPVFNHTLSIVKVDDGVAILINIYSVYICKLL